MMKVKKRYVSLLLAALAGGAMAQEPVATSPDGTNDDIQALRTRIEQLELRHAESVRKAEQAKTSEQVISDAARRSQLMEVGQITAGHKDGRFFIGSEDDKFMLRPFAQLQFRYVATEREHFKNGSSSDTQSGFEVRRLRFGVDGSAFSPDLTYWFNWGTQRASGSANVVNAGGTKIGTVSNSLGGGLLLEEAWVKYRFHDTPWYIRAGQIRNPLMHDEMIGTVKQQAVERGVAADIFANAEGFTEAVEVIYDPKTNLRAEGGINHGFRSANTNYLDFPNSNAFNFGLVGRVEYKVMGDWKDYAQIGAVDVKNPLLVIGVAADYSERGHNDQTVATIDVMYADPSGLSLYGGVVDRWTNHNFGFYAPTITGANVAAPPASVLGKGTNEYAMFIQAGYLINKQIEPYARFEYIHVAGTAVGSNNYIPTIAGGVNYYLYGHKLKLTAQLLYLPHGIPFDDLPNDIQASPNSRGEISGVVQVQFGL